MAGHARLELRNVVAKYPVERSHRRKESRFNLLCGVRAMRARVIFISKHRCRLSGDCANLRPPRADDRRVAPNQSSKAPSIGEKLEMSPTVRPLMPLHR